MIIFDRILTGGLLGSVAKYQNLTITQPDLNFVLDK